MNESNTNQQFKYEDIGPKTILYLAEGLYPDARDPIREYVQNAVDAKATEVALLVSGDSITIENNGQGMDTNDFWRFIANLLYQKKTQTKMLDTRALEYIAVCSYRKK